MAQDSDYDPDEDDDVGSDHIDDDAPGPSRKRGAAPIANGKKDDVSGTSSSSAYHLKQHSGTIIARRREIARTRCGTGESADLLAILSEE